MSDAEVSPLAELEKDPQLLPTRSLSADEFEDFVERLLHAHRFAADVNPRVVRVERWGRKGDKQDGIDFEGTWSDSRSAAWQCKRLDKLTPSDVDQFVQECTFIADSYFLTYSGEASSDARKAMAAHPGWELLDQRGLGRILGEIPLHRRRQVLDETWGVQVRKLLLRMPGEDSFLTMDDFIATRTDETSYLNDLGPFVARQEEADALRALLDPSGDWSPVIIVSGNGGAGKSRLMSQVLRDFELTHPELAILWLTPGRSIDAEALGELPHSPAIVVIDDAHRDPAQLGALLSYRKAVPETRIVLGSRRAGQDPLRALLLRDGLTPAQIGEIDLPDLTTAEAKRLVESLSSGLDLPFELVDHLAAKATDSPFIAVLAVNMIRRGELTGPLAMDNNLREVVLARYEELLVGAVGDFSSRDARRLLATFAALGSVDLDDEELRGSLAAFVGLSLLDYIRLCKELDKAGVLITRGGMTRVAPDILADQVLEREAVESGIDTTFVRQLWAALGRASDTTLVANLAALGWRLEQRGLPNPLDAVWSSVKQHIDAASYDELLDLVSGLGTLAYTQPSELIVLLDAVVERLNALDLAPEVAVRAGEEVHIEAGEGEGSVEVSDDEAPSRASIRDLFGFPPTSRSDVERLLPRLYGRSAAREPGWLEHVLNQLWDLRQRDSRPPHSHPEHSHRVIQDDLADLGDLPAPDFPARIVEWTRSVLPSGQADWGMGTPLLGLHPLIAKEGHRTRMTDRRTLSMEPYFISAEWARSFRDEIRRLCLEAIGGENRRLAGDAVRVLRDAFREPHGYFGQTVPPGLVESWAEDDVETIAALAAASRLTRSPAVRREIRRSLNWAGEYASSDAVRLAALSLMHELDQTPEDDLVESLFPGYDVHLPSTRGMKAPSAADLAPSGAGHRSEEDFGRMIAESDAARATLLADVAARLIAKPPADRVREVASAVEDFNAVAEEPGNRVGELFAYLATHFATSCQETAEAIAAMPANVLDDELINLLHGWRSTDEPGLLVWLAALRDQRREVRLGVARAFSVLDWSTTDVFEASLRLGWHDPDDEVKQAFLAASHLRVKRDPSGSIAEMRSSGATDKTLALAISRAAGWNGYAWGASLGEDDAAAVLEVLGASGWDDRDERSITSGIASRDPVRVLDGLLADARAGRKLPSRLRGFSAAVGAGTKLAEWLLANCTKPEATLLEVTLLALQDGLSVENAGALTIATESMPGDQVSTLLLVLRHCSLWPVLHPDLAKALIARAEEITDASFDELLGLIRRAMTPDHYGWSNGRSPELDRAYELVRHRRWHETESNYRSMLSDSVEELRRAIERVRTDDEDD
jgi:hypothetical protein